MTYVKNIYAVDPIIRKRELGESLAERTDVVDPSNLIRIMPAEEANQMKKKVSDADFLALNQITESMRHKVFRLELAVGSSTSGCIWLAVLKEFRGKELCRASRIVSS